MRSIGIDYRCKARLPLSLGSRPADADALKAANVKIEREARVEKAKVHRVAGRATQHDTARCAIEQELGKGPLAIASLAADGGIRQIHRKQIAKPTHGGVAVHRHIAFHHFTSPDGPKRSVLMRSPAWPSATRWLA